MFSELTLRCLFLQRSQALLDGTPGIVGFVPISRSPELSARFLRSWGKLHFASLYHTELLHISKIHQAKMQFEGKKSRMNDARWMRPRAEGAIT